MNRETPLAARAIDKVVIGETCWPWAGAKDSRGYGQIREGRRGSPVVGAHRAIYEFCRGPIAEDLDVDHLCRNPSCVRPSHVEPVTHRENVVRGRIGERQRKGTCRNGHPLNGRWAIDHGCRKCMNATQNKSRRLAREARDQ